MSNKEFDKKIQEMMEVHTEVPPVGSWDLIESSLLQRSKTKMLYFRRALYTTVAVAASFVLLLVLNRSEFDSIDSVKVVEQKGVIANLETEHLEPIQNEFNQVIKTPRQVLSNSKKEIVLVDAQKALEELVVIEGLAVAQEQSTNQSDSEIRSNDKNVSKSQFSYPTIEDYKGVSRRKNSPLIAFATNLSPSTGSNSVSLMSMSQAQGGLAPNDVVSTIQKASVPQEVISNTKFLMPVSVGVQVQMPISKILSVGLGVNYTMLFSNYDALSRQETRQTQQTLHYIGIPLNLYANIMQKDNIRLYATGGFAVEKGLYAFYRVSENGVRRTRGESIEGLQWSATGGLGVELSVNNSTGLYFDPTVAYYFENNQPLSIRTSQPLQFKFELGFRFHL